MATGKKLTGGFIKFIERQPLFFVATAASDGRVIPDLSNSDPFHRSDFFRRQGARRAVVRVPQVARNVAGGKKRPALRVGHSGPSGALHCLSDAPHRAAHCAYPSEPL